MGREDLPESLEFRKSKALSDHNPVELATLASKPDKTVPLPKDKPRLRGLAQYTGRRPEGKKKSLANLRRPVTQSIIAITPPAIPPGTPVPTIATAPVPRRLLDTLKEKYWRAVLTKEEWDLFLRTWVKYLEAHPDYNEAEDEMDLETICYEEVQKWRINLLRMKRPEKRGEFDISYNQAHLRQQKARENLAARRSDRLGINAKGAKTINNSKINIAVLAGNIDEQTLMELQQKAQRQLAGDMEFLKNTKDITSNLDVIDAEIVEDADAQEMIPPHEEGAADAGTNG